MFLHLRDVNDVLDLNVDVDGLEIVNNILVKVRKRRENNAKLVLLISMSVARARLCSEDLSTRKDSSIDLQCTPSTDLERRLYDKLHIRSDSVTCVPISKVHTNNNAKTTYYQRLYLRKIRGSLRQMLPEELYTALNDQLSPHSGSAFAHDAHILELLQNAEKTNENAQKAAKQLCGRAVRNKALTAEDVRAVLKQIHVSRAKDEAPQSSDSFENRMKELRNKCNSEEKDLIDCVVNTSKLETTYDNLVIDQETKATVKQLVSISQLSKQTHPLLRQVQMKGALFYGPPGTGKTHLTRAIARESGAAMVAIDAAKMEESLVGETEKKIQAVFSLCSKLHPCILFIDEADALFYRRGSNDYSWRRTEVTQFLQQMDGLLSDEKTPFVIVATNRPSDLDEAFLRRLPYKAMFSLPTDKERASILRLWLRDDDLDDPIIIDQLVRKTEGYSGADLKSLCSQAALTWQVQQGSDGRTNDTTEENKMVLNAEHFAKALKRSRPTGAGQMKKSIDAFHQGTAARTRG